VTNTVTVPLGAVAARIAGVPHVWYLHEYGSAHHGVRFDLGRALSLRLVGRLSDLVLVNSNAVAADVAPLVGDALACVYYAVDVASRDLVPIGEGPLRLVQVATLAPGKGQIDAVRALGLLGRRNVDVRLRLVGPDLHGHAASVLEAAGSEGVADRLEWVGFDDDPAEHVLHADIALTCSRMEAFGRTTVEAMKLGRPVVGADSGGTTELIRNGWNGLLYPPGDVHALVDRIERLDRDRALLQELGSNARAWATSEFTLDRFADGLLAAFDRAAARRHGPEDVAN
jgi:glycosyltransferase involved in cell wall biosynthesis